MKAPPFLLCYSKLNTQQKEQQMTNFIQNPSAIVAVQLSRPKHAYRFSTELNGPFSDYLNYAFNWIDSIGNRVWHNEDYPRSQPDLVTFNIYSIRTQPEEYNLLRLLACIYESFPDMVNTIDLYYKQNNAFGNYTTKAGYKTANHYVYDLAAIPEDYHLFDFTTFENVVRNWQGLMVRYIPVYGNGGIELPTKETTYSYKHELSLMDRDEVLL